MNPHRVWIGLKPTPHYRRESFARGFQLHGFKAEFGFPKVAADGDVLLIWNRQGDSDTAAAKFERAGNRVLVAENGYLGKTVGAEPLYALARNHHNGAGTWRIGDVSRWERFHIDLCDWRSGGSEIVFLPQRSIGEQGIAMPHGWTDAASRRLNLDLPHRIRPHPGIRACIDLMDDLRKAAAVCTWGSGAAIKALIAGIPVIYDFEKWIGAMAASRIGEPLKRDSVARQHMFERLAWAQWRLSEIEDGTALEYLL